MIKGATVIDGSGAAGAVRDVGVQGVRIAEVRPDIDADAVMIRQVMHNLIRNAMEAMESQSDADIRIATRQIVGEKRDMIEVSVTDDGPGFRSEAFDEIFEPYVTTKPKGTGLGLAIVKKLIEEHGGNIWIESTSSIGACVRFQLPLTKADARFRLFFLKTTLYLLF